MFVSLLFLTRTFLLQRFYKQVKLMGILREKLEKSTSDETETKNK